MSAERAVAIEIMWVMSTFEMGAVVRCKYHNSIVIDAPFFQLVHYHAYTSVQVCYHGGKCSARILLGFVSATFIRRFTKVAFILLHCFLRDIKIRMGDGGCEVKEEWLIGMLVNKCQCLFYD